MSHHEVIWEEGHQLQKGRVAQGSNFKLHKEPWDPSQQEQYLEKGSKNRYFVSSLGR